MVKVHDDLPPSMADPTATSPTTSSTPSTSSITRYVPSRKSRPFKSLHPNSYKNSHSNFCVDPSAFSSLNPIHLHNVHNPPFHYFIHHHHCPFPPPQCAEMCNGGVISMNGEGGVAMANGGVSSGAATSGAPAKFYFGPGFEPQRAGFYAAGPGPSSASAQGRTREEYVVYLHVNPGVTISLTMGDGNVEVLRGPVTVPMVSTNSSPPIAMPVQVPPGHVVQQIVDENGTLRHVILSPSHHPPGLLSLPSHNPQHYGSGGPGSGSNQSQQYYPGGIAGFPPQPYHTMQGPHPIPSPTHLGHSPPPNPAYYKDERAQRQHIKLKKKLQEKHQKGPELSPRKDLVNGLKRSPTGSTKDKGMNSVGTSEDGEESSVPDEEDSVQVVTDVLSSVQAPKVLELSSRSALLQWAPPLHLSESVSNDSGTNEIDISETDLRYEVLLSDKSREMKFKSIYNGSSHSCRIQDLKPGQEYSVCLQVHLDELQGYATDPVKFVTPACEPDQPLPPKLGAKTKNSLQLRWNQVNDNGARILFYSLEYDAGKGGEFEEIHKSRGKTQFNLQKLLPATAYRFRLAVVNEVGKSAYSDTVTYRTTENPPAQPDAPTLIEATVSTLHLKWNHRPKDDEFVLQMNDPKTKYGHMNVYNGRETYYICQRLSCYSDYTFRLKANNEGGTSPWSEEVTFRTKPDRPDRPSKPVVKGRIHAYSFRLKWEPPHNTGGAEITHYILEVNSGSGYEQVYSGSETEAVCDRLTPGTTYQLRVSCASSGGQSCPSDPCTVTTEAIGPGKCGTPKLVGKARADALTVRWAEPDYNGGAPVIDYELELTNPDSSRLLIRKNKETECTISQGIIPGQEYAFTVRAVNRICAGAWSDTLKVVSGAAPPGEPTKLTLTCRSAFHVSIEWNEPPSNGAPISDYRLEMCPDTPDDVSQFSSIYQGPLACYEAKNLSPFRKYFFRVQATNSAGVGPYSPISATITPAATPSAVSILKSESTPTTITLWWSEPNSNGSEIIHYNIDLGDNAIETDGPTTEYSLENLKPETQYRIKIQAVNAVGPGNFSSTWKTSTLRLPPTPPVLECIGSGHNYLKLKWGEGKNIDYTQFSVEMENLRSKEWQCVYRGTALTCKVNKLHELTTYRFRINASNDAGIGDFSEEYQFSTGIAPPSILKMPKVTEIEQRTCTIEWLPSKNGFSDPIIYQVQIARLKEQVYKQVNRTSETKCHIENLEPGVEYCTRVCPIRVTSSSELPGPYSPTLNVTTISADVSAVTKMTPSGNCSSTAHHVFKHRTLATSLFQGVSLKKFYEENLVSIWAVLLTVAAIVMSLCIASFL